MKYKLLESSIPLRHWNILPRSSTHDIELFFWSMGILSFYDNYYGNAVQVSAKAIIARQFSKDLHSHQS